MADTLTARGAPAPSAPAVPSTFTFDAIGTRWCVDTDEPLRGEVRDRILDRIRRFDRTYSRFRYGSLPSSIGVSVTLVDDVISAVTVTPRATDPTSLDKQTRFARAIPALVVGRNIDEVNLSKVAGSSGTPDGFNAAIQRIKAEATP
jgi:hypothetical protein